MNTCFFPKKLFFLILFFVSTFWIITSCTKETSPVEDPKTTGWAVGNEYNGYGSILHTINKGLNWDLQSTYLTQGVDLYDVAAVSVTEAWVVGAKKNGFGLILHTTDGGVNWTRTGSNSMIPDVNFKCVVVPRGNEIWVGGDSSTILKSPDGGQTWLKLFFIPPIPNTSFTSITVHDNNVWACGEGTDSIGLKHGVVVHSVDGGMSWKRMAANTNLPYKLNEIVSVNDSMVLLAGWEELMRTSDSGATWQNLVVLPGKNLRGLCVMGATDAWFTAGGKSIYHFSDNTLDTLSLPYANTMINDLAGSNDRQIWACGGYGSASTEGLLLFTNNKGNTWLFGQNPCKTTINKVSFIPQTE